MFGELDDHVLKYLNNRVSKIPDGVPTFCSVPLDKFEKEGVIKICHLAIHRLRELGKDI